MENKKNGSVFKNYAKQAKQRLKNNFWGEVILERQEFKQLEEDGANIQSLKIKQKQELKEKIYNVNFESDEDFYHRVKQILTNKDVITNPIALLSDDNAIAQMSEQQKQAYFLKLSNRYQQAVERFNNETSAV
ncbi:MAG: hypothetical protein IKV38_02015 [Clostridia bacterium]|nr:hypothetical protein [Clostridia bacterium]